jgi:hypothetical protein
MAVIPDLLMPGVLCTDNENLYVITQYCHVLKINLNDPTQYVTIAVADGISSNIQSICIANGILYVTKNSEIVKVNTNPPYDITPWATNY